MKKRVITLALLLVAVLALALLTGCGDDYESYKSAFSRVTANGGFDADLSSTLKMDGATKNASGNFKVDNSGSATQLLLTVTVDGETITQFSDGQYLYTDARGEKYKYPLGEKTTPEKSDSQGSAPTYDVNNFLQEFASYLEAGKINELGLLSPLDKSYVTKTTKDGNTYHLTVSNTVLSRVADTLSSSINGTDGGVTVSDLKNFTYDAVVQNDYVTSITYSGTMTVNIPANISSSGDAESTPLDITITAKFNNPGSKVTIDLPSTEGY